MCTLTFGLTGHRLDRLGVGQIHNVHAAIRDLAARIMDALPGRDAGEFRVVSALADGADLIGASALLASGWQLDVVLPFFRDDYRADFADDANRAEFDTVLAQAGDVFELAPRDGTEPEERAYERAGEVIRAQSDVLIAVWDNGPSRGRGGTQEVVSAAVREGLPVIVIDPAGVRAPALLWGGAAQADLGQQSLDTIARSDLKHLKPLLAELVGERSDDVSWSSGRWRAPHKFAYLVLLWALGVRRPSSTDFSGTASGRAALPVPNIGGPGFTNRFASTIADEFAHANAIAIAHSQAFRSSYVSNFTLAAIAVLLAVLGLVLPPQIKPILLALELAAIGAILIQTRAGNRAGWHSTWLDTRAIAERLRCLSVSAQLGDLELRLDAARTPSWVTRKVNMAARALGLSGGRVDAAYLVEVRTALSALIDDQVAYLRREAEQMHRLDHRLHVLGTILFILTAVICAAFLAAKLFAPHLAEAVTPAATLAGAALPAAGAAIYGIRTQGDFASTAERDKALASELKDLGAVLADEAPTFDTLQQRARRVSGLLTKDLGSWLQSYRARPLALPG